MATLTFRFDDICLNSDIFNATRKTIFLWETFPNCHVMWAISPLVQRKEVALEGVYEPILKAHSDNTLLYRYDVMGIPEGIPYGVQVISHGLVHADHRLMSKGAQELSILTSTSLLNTNTFLPPFNHWNEDTEAICKKHNINLIKFEDGWRSLEHEQFNRLRTKWYLHDRNMAYQDFRTRLTSSK